VAGIKAGTVFIAVKGDLTPLDKALKSAWDTADKRTKQISKFFDKMEARIKKSWNSISTGIKDAIIGWSLGEIITETLKLADKYTLLEARVKLVTKSTEEFEKVNKRLFEVSQNTRVSYQDTLTLYARLARATEDLGTPQKDLLRVTDLINKSLKVSGATATESSNALIQFSQGLGAGALRGEELNSVMEQTPALADAIADGMNIARAEFREMAKQGKLTSEAIIEGLLKQGSSIDKEFSKIPLTISDAWVKITNTVGKAINETNKYTGATSALAEAMDYLNGILEAVTDDMDRYLGVTISGLKALAKIAAAGGALWLLPIVLTKIHKAALLANLTFFKLRTGALKLSDALFGVSVKAQLAAGSLKKMQLAGYALMAFFAGWELGKWANDNFEEVRIAGLATVAGLSKAWIEFKFFFLQLWTSIKFGYLEIVGEIDHAMGAMLQGVADKMKDFTFTIKNPFGDDFVLGLDKAASGIEKVADRMKSSKTAAEEHAQATDKLNKERDKAIEIHNRTVEILIEQRDWEKKLEDQNEQTTESIVKNEGKVTETVRAHTDEQVKLKEKLTEDIHELTTSKLEHELWSLDREMEAKLKVAGEDKELQQQVADWYKLKKNDILENNNETLGSILENTIANTDTLKELNQTVVDAFIRGEDAKEAVARLAVDKLSGFATKAVEKGLPKMLEGLGQAVGGWLGFGVSETATEGETWQEKLATGAGYLAAAAGAIMAGKAVGSKFKDGGMVGFAEGGWLSQHLDGGVIRGGTGFRDDVFLGFTGGGSVANWGMANEYVMPKAQTSRYLPQLEAMRHNRFEAGGPVRDPMEAAKEMNNNGFDIFADTVVATGNWKKAIAVSVAWYLGSALAMIGGKEFGKNLFFADGGQVSLDKGSKLEKGGQKFEQEGFSIESGNGQGGKITTNSPDPVISKYIDLINEQIEIAEKADISGGELKITNLLPFDELWSWLRDRGGRIQEIVEDADRVLSIFLRDVFDPEKSVTNATFEEMIKQAYEQIVEELQDVLLNTIDPLGIMKDPFNPLDPFDLFHTGTDFVPKTGPAIIERGERIFSRTDNEEIMNILRGEGGESGGQVVIESKPQIKVTIGGNEIKGYILDVTDDYNTKKSRRGVTGRTRFATTT
jgi:tape measure domain-containing protein